MGSKSNGTFVEEESVAEERQDELLDDVVVELVRKDKAGEVNAEAVAQRRLARRKNFMMAMLWDAADAVGGKR